MTLHVKMKEKSEEKEATDQIAQTERCHSWETPSISITNSKHFCVPFFPACSEAQFEKALINHICNQN